MLGTAKILFLCDHNACHSQMAEAFARCYASEDLRCYSAGLNPLPVLPAVVAVMQEVEVEMHTTSTKGLESLGRESFDLVVTLSTQTAQSCPLFPGNPARVDWKLPELPEAPTISDFRALRDAIGALVHDFFRQGYMTALVHPKRQADLLINNLSEGVLAHDLKRRIVYFNKAAERITGYQREEVLGKDCHEVFVGGFCGEACDFCEDQPCKPLEKTQRSLHVQSRSGAPLSLEMSIKPMRDLHGLEVGVLASFQDCTEAHNLKKRLGERTQFSGIVGRDPKMLEVFELIRDLAGSTVSVLIQGESGTGKELVAAAIHREGSRKDQLFVPVNCGALPENLLESELFGHVRGAFTGAIRDKKGRFELAHGGTIFLDEIGDISPAMQVKLLRVLQEGSFERVGGEQTIQTRVRVISATNKDLSAEVAAGRFREDLYYRLNVMPLRLPPLRQRRQDIPLLAEYLLGRALEERQSENPKAPEEKLSLSSSAITEMLRYDWPGNVRELQNWIQFALIKCKGEEINAQHLPTYRLHDLPSPFLNAAPQTPSAKAKRARTRLSAQTVEAALSSTNGNKVKAAKLLGVGRATLYRFLSAQSALK